MRTLEELIGMAGADTGDVNVTFIVEDTTLMNNLVVHLSPVTMKDLNIWYGVTILLEGNNNRKAVFTVLTDENCGKGKIRMNKVVRNKFDVSLGDSVSLGSFHEIPDGNKIVVRPVRDTDKQNEFLQENLFESYLRPYFFGANRPVNIGDVFSVKGLSKTIQFKVVTTVPSPFCIVGPATVINCQKLKAANKRRENESTEVSNKVKGPQTFLQSSRRPPMQNGEASSARELTTLEDKIKLAYSLQKQGKLQRAAQAFTDVINAQNKKQGPSHLEMLPLKQTLAAILFDLKQFHELAQLLLEDKQVQSIRGRAFLDTKLLVAMFLTSKNKYDDAAGILNGATEHIHSLEYNFLQGVKLRVVFASVLYGENYLEHSLRYLTEDILGCPSFVEKENFLYVLKRLDNLRELKLNYLTLTNPDPDVFIIKYHIGWFYYQLQEYILATKTLQEILPSMKATMGSDHLCTKLADDLLKDCKEQVIHQKE